MRRKKVEEYYLSVEGETEKWYFEHLQKLINEREDLVRKVKFHIKIKKSIISNAKSIPSIYDVKAFHICDYESNEEVHKEQFEHMLDEASLVSKIKKNVKYKIGYSNFSFDLWIILHKKQQKGAVSHRKKYVNGINDAYNEKFQYIDDYKEEKAFKRILSKIELEDVIRAVGNGNEIRKMNDELSINKCKNYKKFKYYTDNPDMTINECVGQILKECGAIKD